MAKSLETGEASALFTITVSVLPSHIVLIKKERPCDKIFKKVVSS